MDMYIMGIYIMEMGNTDVPFFMLCSRRGPADSPPRKCPKGTTTP